MRAAVGIQAEWRLAEIGAAEDDPFEAVIVTTGVHLDLSGGEDAVVKALGRTLRIEGQLFDEGVTCDLKDGGQDCLTCPVFTNDQSNPKARLCALGRDQAALVKRSDRMIAERLKPFRALGAAFASEAQLAVHTISTLALDDEVLAGGG